MKPRVGTQLEKVLLAGQFALTLEVGPPQGPDPAPMRKKAALLKGLGDGYNVTDNQTAVVRMSSIAG
ncbi:MAG: methylenetetrahydrofolate reductase, partial [Deltaproteobacteria bacterium]|nr:methylenetetrahydrofolate reductase [Deltaproteobacteria bacterium]